MAGILRTLNLSSTGSHSTKQLRKLRKSFGGTGRYLKKNNDQWTLDFSNSPLLRQILFSSIAVFHPLFKPDKPQATPDFEREENEKKDRFTMPLNRLMSQMIGFMFRDPQCVNSSPGKLREQISATVIRGRVRGNRSLLDNTASKAKKLGLVNNDFYAYLKKMNGRLRPGIGSYIL